MDGVSLFQLKMIQNYNTQIYSIHFHKKKRMTHHFMNDQFILHLQLNFLCPSSQTLNLSLALLPTLKDGNLNWGWAWGLGCGWSERGTFEHPGYGCVCAWSHVAAGGVPCNMPLPHLCPRGAHWWPPRCEDVWGDEMGELRDSFHLFCIYLFLSY